MGKKPNLFIIGAAKAGTTVLYDYLRQHPEIFLTKEKEPHFFDNDSNYIMGEEWYLEKYFVGADDYELRGEATPAYMRAYQKVGPRIEKFCNGSSPPKIIIVLRDPVKRAWSHYLHMKRISEEKENFESALLMEEARLRANPESWVGYFNDGLYSRQIKAWLEIFPRKCFYFILNDDLYNDHIKVLKNVCGFLGVENKRFSPDKLISNQASQPKSNILMKLIAEDNILRRIASKAIRSDRIKREIIKLLRRKNLKPTDPPGIPCDMKVDLQNKYQKELTELENLINVDLSSWKS